MSKKEITELYRSWRKQYNNQRPDRAIVRMYWEDEGKDEKRTDTIALKPCDVFFPKDDSNILFYAHGLDGLLQLTEVGNGSDFVVTEVLGFYKA